MGRTALAASRAIEILNFLSARPSHAFTLSEIADRLELSVASAHGILMVMTEAGFLARDPVHKTFELGPALVAIGHATLERHRSIDLARDEVRRLADELGLESMASAPIGSDLIVLARAGRAGRLEQLPRVGQRIPLAPPIGGIFLAWKSKAEVTGWFDRFDVDTKMRPGLEALLDDLRVTGYEIAVNTPARKKIERALRELANAPHASGGHELVTSLTADLLRERHHPGTVEPEKTYNVNYCMAPIFGKRGEPILALSLLGFGKNTTGKELVTSAEELRVRADDITVATQGTIPLRSIPTP